jgi:hypothetical protein
MTEEPAKDWSSSKELSSSARMANNPHIDSGVPTISEPSVPNGGLPSIRVLIRNHFSPHPKRHLACHLRSSSSQVSPYGSSEESSDSTTPNRPKQPRPRTIPLRAIMTLLNRKRKKALATAASAASVAICRTNIIRPLPRVPAAVRIEQHELAERLAADFGGGAGRCRACRGPEVYSPKTTLCALS